METWYREELQYLEGGGDNKSKFLVKNLKITSPPPPPHPPTIRDRWVLDHALNFFLLQIEIFHFLISLQTKPQLQASHI